jgi:hypothetical protein
LSAREIRRIEKEEVDPHPDTVRALADALGLQLAPESLAQGSAVVPERLSRREFLKRGAVDAVLALIAAEGVEAQRAWLSPAPPSPAIETSEQRTISLHGQSFAKGVTAYSRTDPRAALPYFEASAIQAARAGNASLQRESLLSLAQVYLDLGNTDAVRANRNLVVESLDWRDIDPFSNGTLPADDVIRRRIAGREDYFFRIVRLGMQLEDPYIRAATQFPRVERQIKLMRLAATTRSQLAAIHSSMGHLLLMRSLDWRTGTVRDQLLAHRAEFEYQNALKVQEEATWRGHILRRLVEIQRRREEPIAQKLREEAEDAYGTNAARINLDFELLQRAVKIATADKQRAIVEKQLYKLLDAAHQLRSPQYVSAGLELMAELLRTSRPRLALDASAGAIFAWPFDGIDGRQLRMLALTFSQLRERTGSKAPLEAWLDRPADDPFFQYVLYVCANTYGMARAHQLDRYLGASA